MGSNESIAGEVRSCGSIEGEVESAFEHHETRTLRWWMDHADKLDRNWHTHHDFCLKTIAEALGLDAKASIPDMVKVIKELKRNQRT